MIIQVDDVLAAMLEKKIAEVKADFAKNRDGLADKISKSLIALRPVMDSVANETTLREAKVLAYENSAQSMPIGNSLGARVFKDSLASLYKRGTEVLAESRTRAMTRDEIVDEFKLSPKAAAAYDRAATIGELFVIQPDLFL